MIFNVYHPFSLNFFLLIILLFVSKILCAQTTINGTVFNNSLRPIVGATVCLVDDDKNILSATITDSVGNFKFNNAKTDYLHVSHVAYEDNYVHVQNARNVVVCLTDKVEELDEITIVVKRPVLEMRNGNIVANISQMPNAEKTDLTNILSRIPGVKANESDGLMLNGKTAVLYIDGRKQNLPEGNLIKLLKSMPASSMEQVELVNENDGTYDIEIGAVIKLKTKSHAADGIYFSIGVHGKYADEVTSDTDDKFSTGGDAFFVVRRKNITFNTTFSYDNDNCIDFLKDSTIYLNSTIIKSRELSSFKKNDVLSASNLSFDLKKIKIGIVDVNFMIYQTHAKINTTNEFEIHRIISDSSHIQLSDNQKNDKFITGFIGYKSSGNSPYRLNLSYSIANNVLKSEDNYFDSDNEKVRKDLYLRTQPEMSGWQQTGNLDFQYNIDTSQFTIYAGVQVDKNHVNDKIENSINMIGYNESDFKADEVIAAGYARLSCDLTKKWNLSGAVRVEKEWYKIKLKTVDNWFEKEFFYCLPFANITYSANRILQLKASMYGNVSRANYDQLYPGVRYINSYSNRVGNPNLIPTSYYGVSLSGWLFQECNFGVKYEKTSDFVIGVTKSVAAEHQTLTYMNAYDAKQFESFFNIYHQFFDDALYVSLNMFALYNYIIPKNDFTLPDDSKKYWKGEGEIDVNYDLTDNFSVSTSLWYQPKYKGLQEKMQRLMSFDCGFYLDLFNESLSIAVEAEDLFRTMKYNYETYFDGNVSHSTSIYNSRFGRFVKLSVTYKLFKNRDASDDARYENGVIGRGRFSQSK